MPMTYACRIAGVFCFILNNIFFFFRANNAAEYKCKACDAAYVTKVKNTFYNHLNTVHKMDAKTYVATYGKLSENTRRHECKICGSPIVWHALNIQQHLKIHKEMNLTLKSYYDSYIRYGFT